MRTVLLSPGYDARLRPLVEEIPTTLFPVAGKPFLHHVIESLVARGVTTFDVIASHLPDRIRAEIGDGTRWGCSITLHTVSDPDRTDARVRALARTWDDEPVLVADAEALVPGDLPAEPTTFWHEGRKTGWAVTTVGALREGNADGARRDVDAVLRVGEAAALLDANHRVLAGEFDGVIVGAREIEPGIWLDRNVQLHPTAKIVAPAYVGADTTLGAGAVVGPGAAIGDGCMIERGSRVAGSVVCDYTYIGEELAVEGSIVDRTSLYNVALEAAVTLPKDIVFGNLEERTLRSWLKLGVERLAAYGALTVVFPFLAVTALVLAIARGGRVLREQRMLRLPATQDPMHWKTFSYKTFGLGARWSWLDRLPALLNVVMGDIHFVGVEPRTPEDVEALPDHWRAIYLRGRAGLATVARLRHGADATPDELYTCESSYVMTRSVRRDLALLFRWRLRRTGPNGQ